MPRFMGGMLDEECPHGLGRKAWCVLCNGRGDSAPKKTPPKKAEPDAKPVPIPCEVCVKKAAKHGGHVGHRRFVKVYDTSTVHGRNPDRSICSTQTRAVWNATHKDDAGRNVCDECCGDRCTTCKAWDPNAPKVPVLTADKVERIDVWSTLLTENSGLHQHLHGTSVSGNIG